MTPQERQQKGLEIRNAFESVIFKFKGKPGDEIPFEFTYNGELDIQSIQPGCGCTEARVENNKIVGHLKLDPLETYNPNENETSRSVQKSITVYFHDGQEWYTADQNKVRKANSNKLSAVVTIAGVVDFT